jgi:hypothetical protein
LISTHSTYGERESGFSIPNSALGQSNLDAANDHSRKIQETRDTRKAFEKVSPFSAEALKEAQDKTLKKELEKLYPEKPKSVSELLREIAQRDAGPESVYTETPKTQGRAFMPCLHIYTCILRDLIMSWR